MALRIFKKIVSIILNVYVNNNSIIIANFHINSQFDNQLFAQIVNDHNRLRNMVEFRESN